MSIRTSAVGERRGSRADQAEADAFQAWVRAYLPVMTGLANRLAPLDAEDVVQEALIAAWRVRNSFDDTRGTARSWLLMLTAQAGSRHQRTRRRRPLILVAELPPIAEPQASPDLDLRHAVDKLSLRQRLAVTLFYYLDLPLGEVAAVMGCSDGTVKSTLADARDRLRDQLQENR